MPTIRCPSVFVPGVALLIVGCSADQIQAPASLDESESFRRQPRQSFALDFVIDFVEVPDAPSLDVDETYTLEAWINPRSVTSDAFQHVISKWNGGGDASYTLELHAGRLRAAVHDGINPTQVIESIGQLVDNEWQHVAVTFDRGTITLYIDGRIDRTEKGFVTPMNSTRPLSFGHEGPPFNGWWYDGLIDEVRVWRVARSPRQIRRGLKGLGRKRAGLVGWWRFDEGRGDIAADASGNGNDGRLGAVTGLDDNDPSWTPNSAPVR